MKVLLIAGAVMILLTSCYTVAQPEFDAEAIKTELDSMLNILHQSVITSDTESEAHLLMQDVLICGTDPSEYWDKSAFFKMQQEQKVEYPDVQEYTIDKRLIRVSHDGCSAMCIEEFYVTFWCENLPLRLVSHWVSTTDGWKSDLLSWAFIPKNEDVAKLDASLEE